MTWTEDKLAEFSDMLAEFGATSIYRNGLMAQTLKSPDARQRTMTMNVYKEEIKSTFDIAGTEFDRLGLTERARFTCNQTAWEVSIVRDDRASNPIVQFDAIRQN